MSRNDVPTRAALANLLARRSAKRGTFVLSSGRESDLYVDARLTTMSPEGLHLIGSLALQAIRESSWTPDSVGGLTLGADPVSYSIAYASASSDRPIRAFTVRKEPKAHGTQNLIEGPFLAGDHVVVIEDVVTSGGSALRATEAIRQAGGTVLGALAVVDRQEDGRATLRAEGVELIALVTLNEVLSQLEASTTQ
jgi:orotate phosphoribosyltransferase